MDKTPKLFSRGSRIGRRKFLSRFFLWLTSSRFFLRSGVFGAYYNLGAFWRKPTPTPTATPSGGNSGFLFGWGQSGSGQNWSGGTSALSSPAVAAGLTTQVWTQVASCRLASYALNKSGQIWAIGDNTSGALGGGATFTAANYTSPIQVGGSGSSSWQFVGAGSECGYGIATDGSLWSWGLNSSGQLGQNNLNSTYSSPTQVGTLKTWTFVDGGINGHTAALQGNLLFTWGTGAGGQLGNSGTTAQSSPVPIGGAEWLKVCCGVAHTLGIKTDKSLWAWGKNASGEVGDSSVTTRSSPVGLGGAWSYIAAGASASYGIQTNGSLWAWGTNNMGQLGLGNSTSVSSPVQVGGTDWSMIASHFENVLAIKTDGSLWAWGSDSSGEVGNSTVSASGVSSPVPLGTTKTWFSISTGTSLSNGLHS